MFLCLSLVVLLSLSMISAGKITPVSASAGIQCADGSGNAEFAIDGNEGTMWRSCSGSSSNTWVEVNLGAKYDVDKIRLKSAQPTTALTNIYLGGSSSPSALVHTFQQYTAIGDWLEYSPSPVKEDVQYIRVHINSTNPYSWLGWYEIEVYGEKSGSSSTCTDSDGGKDYSTKGRIVGADASGNSVDYTDKCYTATKLYEGYCYYEGGCSTNGCAVSEPYECPNGCLDGACVTLTTNFTCTDSDGGKNYGVKGEIRHFYDVHTSNPDFYGTHVEKDSCNPDGTLREYSCEYYNPNELGPSKDYDCALEGKVCSDGACASPSVNYINGCSYLNDEVVNRIDIIRSQRFNPIVLREGDKIHRSDYIVIPDNVGGEVSTIVRLTSVKNQSAGYANDVCRFEDVFSGNRFSTAFTSEGIGNVSINGRTYIVTMSGAHTIASEDYVVTLDFPQTSGSDKFDFGNCSAGSGEQSCQSLINKVKNPVSYFDNGLGYELRWNSTYSGSWWTDNGAKNVNEYYADWRVRDGDTSYNLNYNVLVFEDKNVDAIKILEGDINWNICQIDNYWTEGDNRGRVYVCNWDALNPTTDISNYENNHRDIMWARDNVLVRVYVSWGSSISDEEVARLQQKRMNEILNSLIDNPWNYVGWENFNLEWPVSSQIEDSLGLCGSDVPEETCSPCWSCKTEPVICPPHGEQKQICRDTCCDNENKESSRSCSPGICSGCYVPRWFGDKYSDNKCVPYGFRFAQETGDFVEKLIEEEEYDTLVEGESDYSKFVVESDTKAILTFYDEEGNSYETVLTKGEEVELTIPWNDKGITYVLYVEDINYNPNGESNAEIVIKFERMGREYLTANMYCDIDGNVKVQKSPEYDGSWAKCQNNYECESNICSSGECIELANAIKEAGRIKKFFFGILCKIANPISTDEYNDCMVNLLGGDAPVEESSSGGGGGGSSSTSNDCTPSYSCTLSPSECPEIGKQTRNCVAVGECGEDYAEEVNCIYEE